MTLVFFYVSKLTPSLRIFKILVFLTVPLIGSIFGRYALAFKPI